MEAQLQQLGVRCQQLLNKGCRQLCVDLVHYLKANAVSTMTSKSVREKKSTRAAKLYWYISESPLKFYGFARILRKDSPT